MNSKLRLACFRLAMATDLTSLNLQLALWPIMLGCLLLIIHHCSVPSTLHCDRVVLLFLLIIVLFNAVLFLVIRFLLLLLLILLMMMMMRRRMNATTMVINVDSLAVYNVTKNNAGSGW